MSIFSYFKKHSVISVFLAIFVVIVMLIGGRLVSRKAEQVVSSNEAKKVSLVSASDFRGDVSVISADGVVESVAQVDLKSQLSAPVLYTSVAIGDYVNKGQVIVELQNADLRAQLDQARANLALARGQFETGTVSIDSARKAAIDSIKDSYFKVDDVVNGQLSQFLFNQNTSIYQLPALITDSRIYDRMSLQWTQVAALSNDWKIRIANLSDLSTDEEVDNLLILSQKNLSTLITLLDSISLALADVTKSATTGNLAIIGDWKQIVATTRTSVSGAVTRITSAQTALANARVLQTSTGQAQIKAAEAGVKNLEAQLAKTVITAPISGRIAALPLRNGELATPGQLIATVVGSGGLQIKAYASGEDLARLKKDAKVKIRGDIKGVVTSVSPSVSQVNKKVEIKITIDGVDANKLVIGESVQALIEAEKISSGSKEGVYLLPIQNVKIVPGDAYVFIVNNESKVEKVPVVLGEVRGDFIEVKNGLNDEIKIISPVYEIEEGEIVEVQL